MGTSPHVYVICLHIVSFVIHAAVTVTIILWLQAQQTPQSLHVQHKFCFFLCRHYTHENRLLKARLYAYVARSIYIYTVEQPTRYVLFAHNSLLRLFVYDCASERSNSNWMKTIFLCGVGKASRYRFAIAILNAIRLSGSAQLALMCMFVLTGWTLKRRVAKRNKCRAYTFSSFGWSERQVGIFLQSHFIDMVLCNSLHTGDTYWWTKDKAKHIFW